MLQGPHLVVSPNCHREWGRQRTDWGTSGSADNASGSEEPNPPGRWGKTVQNLSQNQQNSVTALEPMSYLDIPTYVIYVMPGLQEVKQPSQRSAL